MNALVTTQTALVKHELVSDLVTQFINFADVKEKSKDTYLKCIKQFFVYLADNGITAPGRTNIIEWRDFLLQEHKATTVQTYLASIKLFFRWCAEMGIYENIADHVKGAHVEAGHKKDYLTAEQAKDVISECDTTTERGARDYALLCLMITTGLRTIEIERANIEDIRTKAGESVLYIQGKGRDEKSEYVKLAPRVEKAIRDYLTIRGEKDTKQALFATTGNRNQNGRMGTRSIRGIVKTHLREAGLDSDRLTAHSLRHTAGTLALLNGSTIRETQQLLRHKNINTTMIYSHELDRDSNHSENHIADAIF